MKTILFDLDGTLTDPKEGIVKSLQHSFKQLQKECPDEQTLTTFIGPPLQQSYIQLGLTEDEVTDAIRAFRERFIVAGMYENKVYEGIPQLLQTLKQKNYRLAVATSKPYPFAQAILRHFELDTYFDYIAGSKLDGTRTAKGDVISRALNYVQPQGKVIMVGDRKHDIIGGQIHALHTVGVEFGYGSKEELQQAGADCIVESVDQLQVVLLQ